MSRGLRGGGGSARLGSSANSSRQIAVLSRGYYVAGGQDSQHQPQQPQQRAARQQPGRRQQPEWPLPAEEELELAGLDFTTEGHLDAQQRRVYQLQERLARGWLGDGAGSASWSIAGTLDRRFALRCAGCDAQRSVRHCPRAQPAPLAPNARSAAGALPVAGGRPAQAAAAAGAGGGAPAGAAAAPHVCRAGRPVGAPACSAAGAFLHAAACWGGRGSRGGAARRRPGLAFRCSAGAGAAAGACSQQRCRCRWACACGSGTCSATAAASSNSRRTAAAGEPPRCRRCAQPPAGRVQRVAERPARGHASCHAAASNCSRQRHPQGSKRQRHLHSQLSSARAAAAAAAAGGAGGHPCPTAPTRYHGCSRRAAGGGPAPSQRLLLPPQQQGVALAQQHPAAIGLCSHV
jgi:hypothetical protein